jgi:hypothetical protein
MLFATDRCGSHIAFTSLCCVLSGSYKSEGMRMDVVKKQKLGRVGIGKSLGAREVIGHAERLFRQIVRLESQRST